MISVNWIRYVQIFDNHSFSLIIIIDYLAQIVQDISHQYLLHLFSINLEISYSQDIQLFISVLLYITAKKEYLIMLDEKNIKMFINVNSTDSSSFFLYYNSFILILFS